MPLGIRVAEYDESFDMLALMLHILTRCQENMWQGFLKSVALQGRPHRMHLPACLCLDPGTSLLQVAAVHTPPLRADC